MDTSQSMVDLTHIGGMKKVWFTSDTHFGHLKIPLYSKREFCLSESELSTAREIWSEGSSRDSRWHPSPESVARMDDHIISKINESVGRDDILWHLGDFCYWKRTNILQTAISYRNRINCRNVFLVFGNHDFPEIMGAFDASYPYREIKVQSKHIVLSHYAHCFWNRSHYGSWMLYGHAHGSAENWLDKNMPGRLSMDVGVDNAYRILGEYRPFSFREVASIMEGRTGFKIDASDFTLPKNEVECISEDERSCPKSALFSKTTSDY